MCETEVAVLFCISQKRAETFSSLVVVADVGAGCCQGAECDAVAWCESESADGDARHSPVQSGGLSKKGQTCGN